MPDIAKGLRIHQRWFAMFAGEDLQYVPPIMRRVTQSLARESSIPSVERVTDTFVQAYVAHRLRIAEQSVLTPLNLDVQAFTTMVSTNDNESLRDLVRKLNEVPFSVYFLVGGFDNYPSARIFSIGPPGVEGDHDDVGFWSIGSGSEAAVNNLFLRGYNRSSLSLPEAIYQVAESKFVAETSLGVGARTAIAVLRVDGSMAVITRRRSDDIRQIWMNDGRPPMPPNLDERIGPLIRFLGPLPSMPVPPDSQESGEKGDES